MGYSEQSFGKLLEQYMFTVADQFIDKADQKTQAKIIALINSIEADTPALELDECLLEQSVNTPTAEPEANLAVHEPDAVDALEYAIRMQIESFERTQLLIATHQVSIDATTRAIGQLQRVLRRSRKNKYDKDRQQHLVHHYQSLIRWYKAYLIKIKALQQLEQDRLELSMPTYSL